MAPRAKTRPFPYRVIDTNSLEFTEILDGDDWKDRYVILSHTWTDDERTEGTKLYEKARQSLFWWKNQIPAIDSSTSKLLNAMLATGKMGHRFIWIDSYCMNKEDKDEKEMSIPSMGDWYMNAHTCLVFLEDLSVSELPASIYDLRQSPYSVTPKWAYRGWTFQEIVLSQRAIFFNKNWEQVFEFDREKPHSLRDPQIGIAMTLSGVNEDLICSGAKGAVPLETLLQYALARQVTYNEDRVKCIAGLANVKLRSAGEDVSSTDLLLKHIYKHHRWFIKYTR